MWENEKNNGGKYFQLDYQIQIDQMDEFSKWANFHWKKLASITIEDTLHHSEFINGIRFVDKKILKEEK